MITDIELQEAIDNCDRDPIHTPNTIQSFGALVAADKKLQTIEFASLNTSSLLGIEAADLLDRSIDTLLDREEIHKARNCLSHNTIDSQREVVGEKKIRGQTFQISIHLQDERSILEFLPTHNAVAGELGALEQTRTVLTNSIAVQDFQTVLDASVENLWITTGYDRVKAYRFLPDDSGEVVSESRSANIDSFLGMRFPATDIPPIARKLYATTPIRVIADVNAEDVPIVCNNPNPRPLDLSLAILRGNAEYHLRYLRNMGVRSTMSLPLIVNGEMWGLFAMHHMKPRKLDPTILLAAELSGKMLSLLIQHTKQTRNIQYLDRCKDIANQLSMDGKIISVDSYWNSSRNDLIEAIPSRGIAYLVDDLVYTSGSSPDKESCLAIRELARNKDEQIQHYNDLIAHLPECNLKKTAGALVLPLSPSSDSYIMLFRDLAVNDIKWAGSPTNEITKGKEGFELNPRNSFSQYKETVANKSQEWTSTDIEVATALQIELAGAFESERVNSRNLRLMVQELNHRVRNILSLVQSLSSNSRSSATSLEGYAKALEQRIIALAGAHDVLTRQDLSGVGFDEIASLELKPYLEKDSNRATTSGPTLSLNPDTAPIITLVLHELTTNAVKYGALSNAHGKVSLTWAATEAGLEIDWQESDGPPVVKPEHEGFGRSLIENAIPYEFGGKAEINFAATGLQAKFLLPHGAFETAEPLFPSTTTLTTSSIEQANAVVTTTIEKPPELRGGLIVEDNYVIAMENKRWFKELGFQEIVAVTSVESAIDALNNERFDFCMLDVNLRGAISKPVAQKLTELAIPFVFASGYGSEGHELSEQFSAPFLTKPVSMDELRATIKKMGIVSFEKHTDS